LLAWQLGPERKEFPVVAYNSRDDYYMVVWEYDYGGALFAT
jgi:hypothetical protein